MSRHKRRFHCPYCGDVVKVERGDGREVYCLCQNEQCGAVIRFRDGRQRREVERHFKSRRAWRAYVWVLIGVVVGLIGVVLCCALSVTERAENVSRETIAPQPEVELRAAVVVEQPATECVQRIYTDADAVALAQMAWGECRGVGDIAADDMTISGTYQKAATMWCVLNRYDAGFEDSIVEVVAAPRQFHGYDPEHPISDELLALAYDVLDRWQAERAGDADAGRVLPADYLFFVGDGANNYFSVEYASGDYYTWELPDVYAEG